MRLEKTVFDFVDEKEGRLRVTFFGKLRVVVRKPDREALEPLTWTTLLDLELGLPGADWYWPCETHARRLIRLALAKEEQR